MPISLQVFHTSHICIYTLEILSIGIFIKMKFEKNVIYSFHKVAQKRLANSFASSFLENINLHSQNIVHDIYRMFIFLITEIVRY